MTYIEELQDAIRNLYNSEAVYVETVPVKEVFQGQTVWEGEVEVFDLPDSRLENWDKSAADLTWKVGQSDQSVSQDADG